MVYLSMTFLFEIICPWIRQVYLGTEKAGNKVGRGGRGGGGQVLFVRGISNSEQTSTLVGAERVLVMAMDELEYGRLDARVQGSVSSRLFVNVLSPLKNTPEAIAQDWSRIMDRLLSKYATRLLKLGVDEIEVRRQMT